MDNSNYPLENSWSIILAGLFGSLLSLCFVEQIGNRQRAIAVVAGMAMSYYLSPLIAHLFSEGKFEAPIGFLVGLFGMSITAAVFKAIQSSDLWDLIKRRYGGAAAGGEQ